MPRLLWLLPMLLLTACDIAPAQSELDPPLSETQSHSYSITQDPHHPWQFQRWDYNSGSR